MPLTDALIPVYEPQNLARSGFRFQSDDGALCLALNYLFETRAETFGPEKLRHALKKTIAAYLEKPQSDNGYGKRAILPFIGQLFKVFGLTPFKDIRLAFLGGSDYFECGVFGKESDELRKMFEVFRDFSPDRTCPLTIAKSFCVVSQGKYDLVISGNVLNMPGLQDVRNVFAACANILKPGGIAVHGMDYSRDNYETILDTAFHKACHQVRIDNLKTKTHSGGRGQVVDAIVLKQEHSACLHEGYFAWLENNGLLSPG